MSGLARLPLLTVLSLLTPFACGGRSTQGGDEAEQAGQGATATATGGRVQSGSGGSFGTGATVSTGGGMSVAGAAGKAGIGGMPPADACLMAQLAQPGLLTNFDGNSNSFAGGGYYIYQDQEDGGETWPDATASSTLVPVPGGVEGNALHFGGDFFKARSWGAGLGIWLHCVDVSAVAGMRFWLRSGLPIDIGVATNDTQTPEFGGSCPAVPCIPNQIRVLPLDVLEQDEWREVTILFDELAGGSAPFTPYEVVGINFAAVPLTGDGWAFDIWVDELHWITAEGGAGGQPGGGAGGEPGAAGYAGAP